VQENVKLKLSLAKQKELNYLQQYCIDPDDVNLMLRVIWQLTSHAQLVAEVLVAAETFVVFLCDLIDHTFFADESRQNDKLLCALGILVNLTASSKGNGLRMSIPSCLFSFWQSNICDCTYM